MIQKVNNLTLLKNYFTPTGKVANREIKNLRSYGNIGDIYQKKLSSGIIVLQHEIKYPNETQTKTLYLNPTGIQNITQRENRNSEKGFKLISILKKYLPGISYQETQVLINTKNGKIEEKANKYSGIGRGSTLCVTSYGDRKTEFPVTPLAGSIHPAIANKIIYGNGCFQYIEMYPDL